MLDRMEQLARSGAKEPRSGCSSSCSRCWKTCRWRSPAGDDDDGRRHDAALDELGDMIRQQQQLRDKTFRQGQDQRRAAARPAGPRQQGQQGDQNQMGDLRQDQQALRDRLKKLLEQLRQHGLASSRARASKASKGDGRQLGHAGEAMGDAEGELGEGDADGAVDSQGRALEAMRKGAQGMAQAMQQQMGQGPGPGQPGRTGQARANQDTDPLGRPLRGRDYGDDTPSRCRARSTCSAPAASSKSCASASARASARSSSSITSSGC